MTKECFQVLYSNIIYPYIMDLINRDRELGSNCLKFKEKKVIQIFRNYEKKRKVIRRFFMKLEKKPMDRHKIGSVLIYSILKSHVIKINKLTKQTLPHDMLMANEYLAISVALSVVDSYRIDQYDRENTADFKKFCLVIPETFHEDSSDTYIDNLCKALYYLKNCKEFDIFAYANILFLLEAYTNEFNNLNSSKSDTKYEKDLGSEPSETDLRG